MEPTVGDLQLVPGAAKEVPAPYVSCCRVALCTVATSIVMVTLGVLVGKWLRAFMGSHTAQLAQRCLEVAQLDPRYDPRASVGHASMELKAGQEPGGLVCTWTWWWSGVGGCMGGWGLGTAYSCFPWTRLSKKVFTLG